MERENFKEKRDDVILTVTELENSVCIELQEDSFFENYHQIDISLDFEKAERLMNYLQNIIE